MTPVATSGTSHGTPVASIYYGPIANPLTTASDLFISEYVEGSGNNKIIEIANFTDVTVDLSDYKLRKYVDDGVPTDIFLSGTLINGDVYVVADPSVSPPCNSNIDQTEFNLNFNGNDVVELATIANVSIDIIGVIGVDNNFAKDITLRKNPGVGPNTTYNRGDYDSYPVDTCDDIGNHTY